jgi:hypothetical protein
MLFKSDKLKYSLAVIFGIVSVLIGLLLTIGYVLKAVIERLGEPDQSLIFWYLPMLFIGIIFLKLGLGFGIWGFMSLRKMN